MSVEGAITEYPPEEVEWLATTTFNRAVDAYVAEDDEACQRLANLAIEFATCLEGFDRGNLRAALEERRAALQSTIEDEGGEEIQDENYDAEETNRQDRVRVGIESDEFQTNEGGYHGRGRGAHNPAEGMQDDEQDGDGYAGPVDDEEDDAGENVEEDDYSLAFAEAEANAEYGRQAGGGYASGAALADERGHEGQRETGLPNEMW